MGRRAAFVASLPERAIRALAGALGGAIHETAEVVLPRCEASVRDAARGLFDWRDRLYAFVRALPAWQKGQAIVRRVRLWLRDLLWARRARQ